MPEWGWFFQKAITGYDWELVSVPRTNLLNRSTTVDTGESWCVCLGQEEEGLQQPLGQLHPGILSRSVRRSRGNAGKQIRLYSGKQRICKKTQSWSVLIGTAVAVKCCEQVDLLWSDAKTQDWRDLLDH